MEEPESQLLKTDTRGRVRTPRERREALLDEFERSGASGRAFATLMGIKYQTFANWVQARRRQRKAARPVPRLLEAVIEGGAFAPGAGVLRVELPGGAHLELRDPAQAALAATLLRELVQAINSSASC